MLFRSTWKGPLPLPDTYNARGRFDNVAFKRRGSAPGIAGLTGTVDATEKNGKLEMKSTAVRLDMPEVFSAPLDFNSLTATVNWSRDVKGFQIRLGNVAYSNADLEGTLSGVYQSAPVGRKSPGIADISGKLTRADARKVMRYMPLHAAGGGRSWLEAEIGRAHV